MRPQNCGTVQTASTRAETEPATSGPAHADRGVLPALRGRAVALHEHLGHAATCALLGSRATQMGAFYVECNDTRLSSLRIRLVALAGPVVTLMTGAASLLLLRRLRNQTSAGWYFTWLLGTLGLMSAAGYPLLLDRGAWSRDRGCTFRAAGTGSQWPAPSHSLTRRFSSRRWSLDLHDEKAASRHPAGAARRLRCTGARSPSAVRCYGAVVQPCRALLYSPWTA
jgi:hypothetical protein